jgi:predicted transcriptional regulator
MEKVADVLERKYPQFNNITPDCLVSDALYQMSCENVDYLIVQQDDIFHGVITDHDIASKVLFASKPLNKIRVKDFMNRTLPVATSNNSLDYCLQLAERYNARHIAIFDNFTFKGVVSSQDLMQHAFHNRNEQREVAAEGIQGYPWTY